MSDNKKALLVFALVILTGSIDSLLTTIGL